MNLWFDAKAVSKGVVVAALLLSGPLIAGCDGARGTISTGHVVVKGPRLTCRSEGGAGGNRTAAWCQLPSGADLSCAMIKTGTVLRWDRYWKGPACR